MRFLPALGKLAFAAFIVALAVSLTAAFGTRIGAWDYHAGFRILRWGVYVGLGGVAFGALWVLIAIMRGAGAGARYGVIGFLGSLATVAIPVYDAAVTTILPPIHDISTDMEHAPQFEAVLPLRMGAENSPIYDGSRKVTFDGKTMNVSAMQHRYYGDLKAIAILVKPPKLYWHAFFVVKRMGWHLVAFDPARYRIEATATSPFFGFTDDIVIRVEPSGEGARLDIRSESRMGETDYGVNAGHIRSFARAMAGQ
ncbi:MAG TPA: DUF1499 domain-containing protein [Rhizomicrobium sp.]|jgi:hypothetical protein|nr:DUF1499 domain-containing protein [Rhizomicrobium sp.]